MDLLGSWSKDCSGRFFKTLWQYNIFIGFARRDAREISKCTCLEMMEP